MNPRPAFLLYYYYIYICLHIYHLIELMLSNDQLAKIIDESDKLCFPLVKFK